MQAVCIEQPHFSEFREVTFIPLILKRRRILWNINNISMIVPVSQHLLYVQYIKKSKGYVLKRLKDSYKQLDH
jgi:hypothetical protein